MQSDQDILYNRNLSFSSDERRILRNNRKNEGIFEDSQTEAFEEMHVVLIREDHGFSRNLGHVLIIDCNKRRIHPVCSDGTTKILLTFHGGMGELGFEGHYEARHIRDKDHRKICCRGFRRTRSSNGSTDSTAEAFPDARGGVQKCLERFVRRRRSCKNLTGALKGVLSLIGAIGL